MVETSRAVLLRYTRNGGSRRASGLHVAGEFVLTADHCAAGEDHRVVTGGAELSATLHVRTRRADLDVALLHVPGLGALPAPDYARVDRAHARTLRHCVALGFPQWKKSGDGRPVLVQLDGEVPTAEGVDPAAPGAPVLLSLKITNQALEGAPPLVAGEMDKPSATPWAGMSGAVLMTADDVVVGVVRSHAPAEGQASLTITGLDALDRLPAAEAAVFWEALGVRDDAALPVLPPPHRLGAEEAERLCRAQVTDALEDLAVLRGLDLDRRIDRVSLRALRTSGGSSRLTALVGDSGYGKTAELGGWAAERMDTCLLLRGSEVVSGTRHLGDVVDIAVAKVSDRTPPWTGAQLARAQEASGPLLVLLDGLNEIDVDTFATSPEEWLLASLKWLADVGAVGVVSCRPERWLELEDVAARTKVSIVVVGPFTAAETARAAQRYDLAVSSSVAELLRVSLAMRLYADVQAYGNSVSLDGLVDTYVHDRCAVVARAVRTRPRLVLDRVLAAGKELWEARSPVLSPAQFDACFPLATGIGAALLDSGLLIPAGAGYRFALTT